MIGQLAFAVWVATVTLAGIYFGQQYTGGSTHGEAAAESHVRHNDFRTDLFAIPYVDETGIVGYVTGRFTVKTVASQEAGLTIPLPTLIFDALSRHFYAEAGELAKPKAGPGCVNRLPSCATSPTRAPDATSSPKS